MKDFNWSVTIIGLQPETLVGSASCFPQHMVLMPSDQPVYASLVTQGSVTKLCLQVKTVNI